MTEIRQEVLGELLEGYSCPDDLVGPDGLLKKLVGRLVERASQVELELTPDSGVWLVGQAARSLM